MSSYNTGRILFETGTGLTDSASFTYNSTTEFLTTPLLSVSSTTATSTIAGGLSIASASSTNLRVSQFFQNGLSTCSDPAGKLLYNASTGIFSCGLDAGSGASSNVWATTTDGLAIYPTDTNDVVIIGRSSTTTDSMLEVFGTTTATAFVATSSTSTFAGINLSGGCFRTAAGQCLGATDIVDARGQEAVDAVRELTGGLGAQSVCECVGTTQTWETALDAATYELRAPSGPAAERATLWPKPGTDWPTTEWERTDAVRIRFTCGYANAASVPGPIKQAILLRLGDLYGNREAASYKPVTDNPALRHLLASYVVPGFHRAPGADAELLAAGRHGLLWDYP
jgi:hypothetical protein